MKFSRVLLPFTFVTLTFVTLAYAQIADPVVRAQRFSRSSASPIWLPQRHHAGPRYRRRSAAGRSCNKVWQGLHQQEVGAYQETGAVNAEPSGKMFAITAACRFEKMTFDVHFHPGRSRPRGREVEVRATRGLHPAGLRQGVEHSRKKKSSSAAAPQAVHGTLTQPNGRPDRSRRWCWCMGPARTTAIPPSVPIKCLRISPGESLRGGSPCCATTSAPMSTVPSSPSWPIHVRTWKPSTMPGLRSRSPHGARHRSQSAASVLGHSWGADYDSAHRPGRCRDCGIDCRPPALRTGCPTNWCVRPSTLSHAPRDR